MFYSIREVASMLNLTESMLRYWETQFPTIHPKKNSGGVRQYTQSDIDAVRVVYHYVKECGFTLEGARQLIRHDNGEAMNRAEIIDRLVGVRTELQAIGRELSNLE